MLHRNASGIPGRTRPLLRLTLVGVTVIGGLLGCADPEEQSLCTVYDRFLEAGNELRSVSLDGSTAGEAADSVEAVLGQVRHLDAVADTRYGGQLDRLEEALDDLLRTLSSVQEDAEQATWEPLVADDAEAAEEAAQVVVEVIEPVCQVTTT
jgi:hypothetical protein